MQTNSLVISPQNTYKFDRLVHTCSNSQMGFELIQAEVDNGAPTAKS